jgi:arginine deiminase
MNYDLSLTERTLARLSLLGVRTVPFHPDALLAGGGSLRCLTMRLWRGGN